MQATMTYGRSSRMQRGPTLAVRNRTSIHPLRYPLRLYRRASTRSLELRPRLLACHDAHLSSKSTLKDKPRQRRQPHPHLHLHVLDHRLLKSLCDVSHKSRRHLAVRAACLLLLCPLRALRRRRRLPSNSSSNMGPAREVPQRQQRERHHRKHRRNKHRHRRRLPAHQEQSRVVERQRRRK